MTWLGLSSHFEYGNCDSLTTKNRKVLHRKYSKPFTPLKILKKVELLKMENFKPIPD